MARKHANVQVEIWNDPDFRNLSGQAQLLYIQLLTSATLTFAGVADWRPKRIAILSNGRTVDEVEKAMSELESSLFVIVDEDSEEAFVRSFFKWDGLLHKPNVAKAMVSAWGKVHSLPLKAVIVHELRRLRDQFPEWRAFEVGTVQELCEMDSLDPAEMVSGRVLERVPERDAPLLTTNYLQLTTELQATDNALSAQELERMFEGAYFHWPRKTERKKSLEKFKQVCKKRNPQELVSDIARFGNAYAETTDPQFVPALVVWLNGERWTDELPRAKRQQSQVAGASKAEQAWDFVNSLEVDSGAEGSGYGAGAHRELRQ